MNEKTAELRRQIEDQRRLLKQNTAIEERLEIITVYRCSHKAGRQD